MSLDALKKDIETRCFRHIYYLYGSEPYLKRFYLDSLIRAVLPENADLDLHVYEGKTLSAEDFSDQLWLCPIGEYKVLRINDLPASSSVAEILSSDCEIGDDTVVIVFQQTEEPDRRSQGYKKLKAAVEKDGLFVEIKTVDSKTLARWVSQQFRKRGKTIEPAEVAFFLEVEEPNMEFMLHEIDKISAYCDDRITRDALELLCVRSVQAMAYEINDRLVQRDGDGAFAVWSKLQALRTPPQLVLGALYSGISTLYKLKLLENEPIAVRSKALDPKKDKTFLVRRYEPFLAKVALERIEYLMDLCAEIDVQTKSTSTDPERMIVRLIREALVTL